MFRNDFLEKSRYAKIAYHVAATMETVSLNEITSDQALAHLVNDLLKYFEKKIKDLFCVAYLQRRR